MNRAFPSVLSEEMIRVFRFPLWWYGEGLASLLRWIRTDLAMEWRSMGVRLWIAALFRPMYGSYDVLGRIVSFVMRLVVISARTVWWLVMACAFGVGVLLWCLWLPLAIALFFV